MPILSFLGGERGMGTIPLSKVASTHQLKLARTVNAETEGFDAYGISTGFPFSQISLRSILENKGEPFRIPPESYAFSSPCLQK
jgi:hypothetical protein